MEKERFGKLLIFLREENHMSQKDLADKLSVSVSAVSKWENGHHFPDISMLVPLSEVLHVSCEDLLYPEETFRDDKFKKKVLPAKKNLRKHLFAVIGFVTLITAVIGGIFLYRYNHPSYERLHGRYIADRTYGTVYEVFYISSGSRDVKKLTRYLEDLNRLDLWETENMFSDTDVIRISIYNDRSKVASWDKGDHYILMTKEY